ncbi:hypothetical protein LZC95_50190 [Pendulispora brunnea]|uniref:Type VI secretion system tube protein Hcp n=1 Tax=Pendulispora brunnea TaxID=2905690 RepID=A0ABZ2K7B3_9BACT
MPTLFIDDSSSAEIILRGLRYDGITEISWEESREPGEPRGIGGGERLGETRGSHKASGSLKMLLRSWEQFRAALPKDGFGEIPFQVVANVQEGDAPMLTYTFVDVRVTKASATITGDSSDALQKEVDISMQRVVHPGGATLVKQRRTA